MKFLRTKTRIQGKIRDLLFFKGIFIGVGLSLLIIVKQSAFPHIVVLAQDTNTGGWVDSQKNPTAKSKPVCFKKNLVFVPFFF